MLKNGEVVIMVVTLQKMMWCNVAKLEWFHMDLYAKLT